MLSLNVNGCALSIGLQGTQIVCLAIVWIVYLHMTLGYDRDTGITAEGDDGVGGVSGSAGCP